VGHPKGAGLAEIGLLPCPWKKRAAIAVHNREAAPPGFVEVLLKAARFASNLLEHDGLPRDDADLSQSWVFPTQEAQ